MTAEGHKTSTSARALRLAAAIGLCLSLGGPAATAQDTGLGGWLMHLFGGGKPAPAQDTSQPHARPTAVHHQKKKPSDFVPASETRSPGTPGGEPAKATFFIDVVGDSLAVQVAQGLTDAFADRPEVAAQNKAHESSGLVRDDFFDWRKAAHDLAAASDPVDVVVVMVGLNDIQPLKDGAAYLDPGADKDRDRWNTLYAERVESMIAPFRAKHVPVIWLGLPPMRSDKLSSEMSKLNALDREHAEKAGAIYVDIWDAFADANGDFDAFGPDVTGANVKLRGADGVHLTKAGARKAASFLEPEIRRILDKAKQPGEIAALPPDIEQAALDINAQIRRENGAPDEKAPAPDTKPGEQAPGAGPPLTPERPLAGPILPLTDLPTSPDATLAAATQPMPPESDALLKVLRRGVPPPPVAGRADDFSGSSF